MVLAYTFGLAPLALCGLVAAFLSPRIRGIAAWLVAGVVLALFAAGLVALLVTQGTSGALGFWPLVLSTGLGSGLLGTAVSSRFRPRRGEPEGALGG